MTRSFANCSCEGGTIDKPGGGLFFDVNGVFKLSRKGLGSDGRDASASGGLVPFCRRSSMMCLCWSRTEMLRCNCSLMVGSWV